jgi:heme/copper-type cytochrome/quinol oxidase subunit 2
MRIYELYRDMPEANQIGFQDPASPIMEEIINFHNYVMVYLSFIAVGVA